MARAWQAGFGRAWAMRGRHEIMTRQPASSERRIDDIEVLRGLSVLMILVSHLRQSLIPWAVPWWDHVTKYYFDLWPAVDLFFAISGFVIARTLLPAVRAGLAAGQAPRALLAFWVRRAWRILPSAWLWLWLMLLQSAVFNRSGAVDTFHANFEATIAGMLSIANFRLAYMFHQFGYGMSTHYWTLSLEEQFYAVLPLAVLFCGRYLAVVLIVGLLALAATPQSDMLMCCRAQPLILGVLLAMAAETKAFALFEPVALARSRLARLAAFGLPLLCMTAVAAAAQRITTHPADVVAVLVLVLVFIACFDRNCIPPRGILRPLMLWAGTRSYALYLCHLSVFYGAREFWLRMAPAGTKFGPGWGPTLIATAVVVLVVVAELNFRIVERPLRRRGARIARGIWPGAAVHATASA
jgi:peptidoglycan/LPS O-acetylase OafA/YrhL